MSVWGDMDYQMQPLPLDGGTIDRLMSGRIAPEDAPPGYGPVVRLLDAASAEATADELKSEGVVAFALAVRSYKRTDPVSPRRSSPASMFSRARLVAATLAAALAATAGLASAGSLPDAAQDIASEMLAKLGVSVPGPNDRAGTNPDVRGGSELAPDAPTADRKGREISELARTTDASGVEKGAVVSRAASDGKSQAGEQSSPSANSSSRGRPAAAGNGTPNRRSESSDLARTTEASGVDKGAAVSTAASDGTSQAGEHGSAAGAGNGSPPATSPSQSGPATADTASGGSSSKGKATADAASGGRSSAGAGNASAGKSRRP